MAIIATESELRSKGGPVKEARKRVERAKRAPASHSASQELSAAERDLSGAERSFNSSYDRYTESMRRAKQTPRDRNYFIN